MRDRILFALAGAIAGLLAGIAIGRGMGERPVQRPVPAPAPASATAPATAPATSGDRFTRLLPVQRTDTAPSGQFELLVQVGNHDMDDEKYAQAIRSYERALALRDDARVLTDLGICYRHTREGGKALAAFERALKIDPLLWQADYNRAVLLADAGRIEEARAIAERLREHHPGNSDVSRLHETLTQRR